MKYIDADKLIAEIERLMRLLPEEQGISINLDWARNTLVVLQQFITSLQQEQPEVDLEKFTEKIKTFQGRYKYPGILSIKGAMAFMARMFYQYPNVARQWYDRLPKTTMA